MIAYVAILLAALSSLLAWPVVARVTAARILFAAVCAGFAYWYWIPSVNILMGGYLGEEPILPDPVVARDAVWVVLIYHLAALATLCALVPALEPKAGARGDAGAVPSGLIALLVFGAAAGLFVWYFADKGVLILVQVLTGVTSARELADFDNFSASIWNSLRALLEIAVIFVALFLIGMATLERRLATLGTGLAFGAIILVFLGTGTRATLLMALVVILLAIASGQRVAPRRASGGRRVLGLVLAAVLVLPVVIAISARQAISTGQTDPVLALLVVNNDMFRELVFVMAQMQSYQSDGGLAFVMTPFTFVTPTFLGFSRAIPDHVLAFNMSRTGIDLILGAGNVFPGIVADFRLAYGWGGPFAFAAFIGSFALLVSQFGRFHASSLVVAAAQCAATAFLFFSFRNIHPGLVLVLVAGPAGLWLLGRLGSILPVGQPDARRA